MPSFVTASAVAAALLASPTAAAAAASAKAIPDALSASDMAARLMPEHLQTLRHRADVSAAEAAAVAESMYNTTVQIQTRDGVNLNTYLYLPSETPANKSLPVIIERTPYGAVNIGGAAAGWVARGYAVMGQDFRGRFFSTGNFSFWRKGADDMEDTVQWILQQPWSNGKVATMGGSADGIAQYVQPRDEQPGIVSQFVIVATAQIHRTAYQQGAYRQSLFSGWLTAIGEPDYAATVEANEGYSDSYWGPVEVTGHFDNVQWPAVHVGGWWDIFQQQNLDAYNAYCTQAGNVSVRDQQWFVMLPGGHCGGGETHWTNTSWGLDYATTLSNAVADANADPATPSSAATALDGLPWTSLDDVPKLVWYVLGPGELGTVGNYWTSGDAWPTVTPTTYYFSGSDKLKTEPAGADAPSVVLSDPQLPIPTLGGGNLLLPKCGPQDQSELEDRIDVVEFTSDTLSSHVAITGVVNVTLVVSSNVTDTDFVVKLTDVFPSLEDTGDADDVGEGSGKKGAKSMLVQDGIVRMRWREGPMAEEPTLMTPGDVYNVTVTLGPTSYVFNPLHRIRVTVAGSNFPRFSVNPNTGKPLTDGTPGILAVSALYHDAVHHSYLELPVVDLDDMPEL